MDTKTNNFSGLFLSGKALSDKALWISDKEHMNNMEKQAFSSDALCVHQVNSVKMSTELLSTELISTEIKSSEFNLAKRPETARNTDNDKRGTKRKNLYAVSGYDRRVGDRRR